MDSTPVLEAASISMTSSAESVSMARHDSQVPQGVVVGPCTQLRARAITRAVVVLPTPRMPVNRYAGATRLCAMAADSVFFKMSWPTRSARMVGRYLRASASVIIMIQWL